MTQKIEINNNDIITIDKMSEDKNLEEDNPDIIPDSEEDKDDITSDCEGDNSDDVLNSEENTSNSEENKTHEKVGCIYMCTSPSGKKYIGQHNSHKVSTRISAHYQKYQSFLKEKIILEQNKKDYPDKIHPSQPKGFCTALFLAFEKYGYDNFKWEVIKWNIPRSKLNEEEDASILEHNTMTPNGFNLRLNKVHGGKPAVSDETRVRMSDAIKNNLELYRKYTKELEGLPHHVLFFKSGDTCGYKITNHPLCKERHFLSYIKDFDMDKKKQEVLDFLKSLEEGFEYKNERQLKAEKGIPEGIIEDRRKDKFIVCFTIDGKRYTKFFGQKSREENLDDAIEWMNKTKEEINAGTYVEKEIKVLPKGISETQEDKFTVNFMYERKQYTKGFWKNSREENLENAITWMEKTKESLKNGTYVKEISTKNPSKIISSSEETLKELPPGINESGKKGYRVEFKLYGQKYNKSFGRKSKEENLEEALEWMKNKKEEITKEYEKK
jgi:hypothetical protein